MQNIIVNTKINFLNGKDQKLVGILSYPDKIQNMHILPAVVFCHGFTDSNGKLSYLARHFNFLGYATLRFDYAHTGESEGVFENLTISQEIADLKAALNYMDALKFVDSRKMGVIGYSYGGMVAILQALKDSRIKCLGILASVIDANDALEKLISKRKMARWDEKGRIALWKLPFFQRLMLKSDFLHDARQYNILDHIDKVKVPIAMLRGKRDSIISKQKTMDAYHKAGDPKIFCSIEFCGHAFLNPFARKRVCNILEDWFNRWL